MFDYRTRVRALLGVIPYNNIFGAVKKANAIPTTSPQRTVSRVIRGEIVGKQLATKAAGEPHVDPLMCDHPESQMKGRSNEKKSTKEPGAIVGLKWWTCERCKTRWERFSFKETLQDMPPRPTDLVMFGKHKMRSYLEIQTEFPDYARWVIETAENDTECSPELRHLAKFLVIDQDPNAERSVTFQEPMETDSDLEYPEDWDDALL